MNQHIRIAARAAGATLLLGVSLCCLFGFLAAFELRSPNVFHALYGLTGTAALAGAGWLLVSAFRQDALASAATAPPQPRYWRLSRAAALFSLFSLAAIPTGDPLYFGYLLFLLFLLPTPAPRRVPS